MKAHQNGGLHAVIGAIDAVCRLSCICGSACLAGIFILIILEVISRNLFDFSIPFSWDFAAYMMGGCFLLSCGQALKSGTHVRVTALFELLPAPKARLLNAVACLVALAISIAITYALADMTYLSAIRGTTSSSVVKTPLWIPQIFMTIGSIILSLQVVAQFLRTLLGDLSVIQSPIEEVCHE